MPMAINSLEEYEKVVNVSWFAQEKAAHELVYVPRFVTHDFVEELLTKGQLPLCSPIFPNVSALLYRHSKLPQPVLLLLR